MYSNDGEFFEIININNASLPAQSVPDYPEYIERPDFVMFDSKAGVVRACGGNIPNRQSLKDTRTDKCFSFDGFEWTPMASLGKFSINSHFIHFMSNLKWLNRLAFCFENINLS